MSPNELKERAEAVLGGRSRGYVEDAQMFARAIVKLLGDYQQVVDNLTSVQTRCTELKTDRQTLKIAIQKIADADPDDRDEAVAEALVAVGGMP